MKKTAVVAFVIIFVVATVAGVLILDFSDETPFFGIPDSSASAITSAPSSLEEINTHSDVFGTDADPDMITLGPKVGSHPEWPPYVTKTSMEFELEHGEPVLAPIDMVLIGFDNRNAIYRISEYGGKQTPFNDLELCFESTSADWPEMIICTYHLLSSPLLLGHNQNIQCSEIKEWKGTFQADGHLFFSYDDYMVSNIGNAGSCEALIGYQIKRGELIGYAGSVGNHSMVPFRFKVAHITINPTVQKGNHYLHWIQPGSFFYWKCYSPETTFPNGVLAYPFICGDHQLPSEQYSVNYKYITKKE